MEFKNVTEKLNHLNYLAGKYPEYENMLNEVKKIYGSV